MPTNGLCQLSFASLGVSVVVIGRSIITNNCAVNFAKASHAEGYGVQLGVKGEGFGGKSKLIPAPLNPRIGPLGIWALRSEAKRGLSCVGCFRRSCEELLPSEPALLWDIPEAKHHAFFE